MNLLKPSRFIQHNFGALTYQDFRTLWTASFFAGAAAWALIVARGWLIYEISDSSLWVGIVTFTAMFPRVVITPFSGYLSDRFDRRSVLSSMFAINIVHNLILAVLVLTDNIQVWHLITLALVNGSARAAQMPAAGSLVPNLVPRHLLLNAIALNQLAVHGSRLLGPAAIAPMMGTIGVEAAFFLCSGFYVVSFVQTLRIKTASTGKMDARLGVLGNLVEGIKYVYKTPVLFAVVMIAFLHCGLTMSFESLLPVLSRQELSAEGGGFSYLMMAVGAGAIVSVLGMASIKNEATKSRLFLNLGVLSGVAPILLGLSNNMVLALLSTVAIGATQAGFMTLTHTMIQSSTPDYIRGRVSGVYSMHIGGIMASANLINGGLADLLNVSYILISGGVVFIFIMLTSWQIPRLQMTYKQGMSTNDQTSAL